MGEGDREVKGAEVAGAPGGGAAPDSRRERLKGAAGKVGGLWEDGFFRLATGGGWRRGRLEAIALGTPRVQDLTPEGRDRGMEGAKIAV